MTKFFFVIFRGMSLFKRFFKLNLVSVFSLTGLFLMLHTGFSFGNGISMVVHSMAKFDTIRIYISDHSASTFDLLKGKIDAQDVVTDLKLITPDKTRQLIAENSGAEGLSKLSENMFPAYIETSVKPKYRTVSSMAEIADKFKKLPHVIDVSYGKEWAENFENGKSVLSSLLYAAAILFGSVALIVVYQTVSIGLFRYQGEVRVYDVVGGTRTFIMLPFIVMALLTGLICFIISILLFNIIHIFMLTDVEQLLGINIALSGRYTLLFLCFSLFIPAVATACSVNSFLKKANYSDKN